jgi:hypothetical protein
LLKKLVAHAQSPSAAKAVAEKQASYRSGEPLRHPKARTKSSFSAVCKADIAFASLRARLKLRLLESKVKPRGFCKR